MSLILATLAITTAGQTATVDLATTSVITTNAKVKPGTYLRPMTEPYNDKTDGVIRIRGNNITVDFAGAVLRGTPETVEPDQRKGTGIFVEGRNITIKNARVAGYKIGLHARNAPGLKILDSDFSYNWKQRLLSTLEREDLADWMSYHRNEQDEWLRYGAAIYLRKCDGFEVKNTKVHGGQNGLMIMESNKGLAWNNDFSFNSSLGIGMYLSSDNRIMHNKIDWALRGFSYGVYNRGQDSAGILIYEQSHRNVFAYNSVTHGGDGFFLWAGQTTMDTGKGGCNDNLLYGNDWSHAPTNGIEATFSRNNFVNNLILECWHGIWGGYSYESKIIGNVFGYNAEAIAIEHGQDNVIQANEFHRDNEAIYLWFNDRPQDPNWGYPKHRDTRSRDYTITGNLFQDVNRHVLRLNNTLNVTARDNQFLASGNLVNLTGKTENIKVESNTISGVGTGLTVPDNLGVNRQLRGGPFMRAPLPPASALNQGPDAVDHAAYQKRFTLSWLPHPNLKAPWNSDAQAKVKPEAQKFSVAPLRGGMNPFLKKDQLRGWRYMLVDHWGPYDFKSPLLWPREEIAATSSVSSDNPVPQATSTRRFEILGPKGRWRLVSSDGVGNISAREGTVPGFVDVTLPKGKPGITKIVMEYIGAETTDYRGIKTAAGRPVRFGFERFFAPIDWNVKFYRWETQSDPAVATSVPLETAFRQALQGTPIHTMKTDRLDFASGGAFYQGGPADKFATVAEGTFEIPAGEYVLEVTTDDGIRLSVDGKEVIQNAWKHQGPTLYTADLKLGGRHTIKLEHFEISGYAALKVNLRPKR